VERREAGRRAHASRRSRGSCHLGRVALGLRHSSRCKVAENPSTGYRYSEAGDDNHFAQTDTEAAIVEISGCGPTDTHYFETKNDPKSR